MLEHNNENVKLIETPTTSHFNRNWHCFIQNEEFLKLYLREFGIFTLLNTL